jgi:uncharacterized repeat protein (TIGR03803 family)
MSHGGRFLPEVFQRSALALLFALGLAIATVNPVSAQTYTVLYNFTNGSDGGEPNGNLIRDTAGNLYGTALGGGDLSCPEGFGFGCGVVFKFSPSGSETVLYAFALGTDGNAPDAGVVADSQGNLYGTTQSGGTSGHGAVFEVTSTGTETVLYNFTGGADGNFPTGVTLGPGGNLYGSTTSGGTGCGSGCGVFYKLSQSGQQTVLHTFLGGKRDGSVPVEVPLVDAKGNVLGVVADGGPSNAGMAYEYVGGTGQFHKLFFPGGSGLTNPTGGVVPDGHGNFYGGAFLGGLGLGAIYRIGAGQMTTFFSFDGTEGKVPTGRVVFDGAGNLYGVASGGSQNFGIIFKISPSGQETVLHQFSGSDGQLPNGGLVIDASGNLYGTTAAGGAFGHGLLYKLTP